MEPRSHPKRVTDEIERRFRPDFSGPHRHSDFRHLILRGWISWGFLMFPNVPVTMFHRDEIAYQLVCRLKPATPSGDLHALLCCIIIDEHDVGFKERRRIRRGFSDSHLVDERDDGRTRARTRRRPIQSFLTTGVCLKREKTRQRSASSRQLPPRNARNKFDFGPVGSTCASTG